MVTVLGVGEMTFHIKLGFPCYIKLYFIMEIYLNDRGETRLRVTHQEGPS